MSTEPRASTRIRRDATGSFEGHSLMHSAFLTAIFVVAAFQAPQNPPIDFPQLGKDFVAAHCPAGTSGTCKLEEVLVQGYARLPVGPFDLQVPMAMLGEKQSLEHLRKVTQALAKTVSAWAQWQGAQDAIPPDTDA